jgi:hypothetical protein
MAAALSGKKGKKRERADPNFDPSGGKRERNVKFDRQVHVKVGLHVSAFLLLLLQFFNWKVIWGVRES